MIEIRGRTRLKLGERFLFNLREKIIAIMDETSKKIDESPLFEEKSDKHKQFLDSVELVEKELKDINKRIKKIEKRIAPKR